MRGAARRVRRGRALVRALVGVILVSLGVVLIRAFVADIYVVDSGSMTPALFGPSGARGGDAVLVRHERGGAPERFDLVVLRVEGADGTRRVVKRVGGLPGERIQLPEGDLVVNGERLPADAARPAPVPLFDQARHALDQHFRVDLAPTGHWTSIPDEGAWRLDARAVSPEEDKGMLLFHHRVTDGWTNPDGEIVHGSIEVNDAVIECEVRFEELQGLVRLRLVEEGDTFEAVLALAPDGHVDAQLTRRNGELARRPGGPFLDVLAEGTARVGLGRWHHLSFANVDNHLGLRLDGQQLLFATYEKNDLHPGDTGWQGMSFGRVGFGGSQLLASFRGVRVLRDLFYVPVGRYGTQEAIRLGPDEYFVLGDHSADSSDSRHYGPVRQEDLLGRPLRVVWPLDRTRPVPAPRALFGPIGTGDPGPAGTRPEN